MILQELDDGEAEGFSHVFSRFLNRPRNLTFTTNNTNNTNTTFNTLL